MSSISRIFIVLLLVLPYTSYAFETHESLYRECIPTTYPKSFEYYGIIDKSDIIQKVDINFIIEESINDFIDAYQYFSNIKGIKSDPEYLMRLSEFIDSSTFDSIACFKSMFAKHGGQIYEFQQHYDNFQSEGYIIIKGNKIITMIYKNVSIYD